MYKKFLVLLTLLSINFLVGFSQANAARDCSSIGPVHYNTFTEYCYKITDNYFSLRNNYQVKGKIDSYLAGKILTYAKQTLNYLPDDLNNKNYFVNLQTAIEKGINDPESSTNFEAISRSLDDFLEKTNIPEITGNIEALPASGNAPLTVTFRTDISDPTGGQLKDYNYTWWIISERGVRKNIGHGKTLTYTFVEEGNYSIFLDVTSNHRNNAGNIDVIPFSKKIEVSVKEKVASLILKVNSKLLDSSDELKFSPDDSIYGLLFDATGSVPTSGTKFIRTEWDFGNGIRKEYDNAPKIERIVYANDGTYTVKLKLYTNAGKDIERKFNLIIRNPIASIKANNTEGYLGDKFSFSAETYQKNSNLNYFWQIIDLKTDKVIVNNSSSTFNYTFAEKGRYNLKLDITSATGEKDYDSKIIYINSRPPVATFAHSIPYSNKPNTVFLDASTSYDLDYSDEGKLEFSWIINGDRVSLDDANFNGSTGYYTFPNIGEHSIVVEVRDPDDLVSQNSKKINITSNLAVDLYTFPSVIQAGQIMRFEADSANAKHYEWNFGDGSEVLGGNSSSVSHKYEKTGSYIVKLVVKDANGIRNTIEKTVYVGNANEPFAVIDLKKDAANELYEYKEGICNGKGAYIVNRVENVSLSGKESIDISGQNNGLDYTWKIGDKYYSGDSISRKFDEIGCYPVKLTVKSQKNGRESVAETYVKIENIKPTLSSLDLQVKDQNSDPIIVTATAVGAEDKDGVIQSYMWYYYTDTEAEPQGFRSTRTNTTNFVLPKITGTYYFVVVLKDNNEERVSSEEISSAKYFITLTGDNVNTPIIEMAANNTSVKVGEEVIFTTNITNILGQSLNKDATFYWDFDGDGFYDLEQTGKNVANHTFTKAGEYQVKLKVKNKGFSNVKVVTVNVSNPLVPDFDYISIGSEVIFLDKSTGSISQHIWDLGDGNKVTNNGTFLYKYNTNASSYIVKLKITDGKTVKETSKKIVKNTGKILEDRRSPLSVYSNFTIENDKIILENYTSNLQLYVRSNLSSVKYYAVDFDTTNDADLNGSAEDDKDNAGTPGYTAGGPIVVNLNNKNIQKIRIFLLDESGVVLENKELTIEKKYISEDEVIIKENNNLSLDGVSDEVKDQFEKLKNEVSLFKNEEQKETAMTYLQRIKEEWNDDFQKTQIIKEFIDYINGTGVNNANSIIDLAEGLLVVDQVNKDEYSVAFEYLKNTIPENIVCTGKLAEQVSAKGTTCKELLVSKLEVISDNYNVEENRALGLEILGAIQDNQTLTNQDKNDFKAVLTKLVYKGESVDPSEIPGTQKDDGTVDNSKKSSSGILGKIGKFLLWFLIIGLGLFLIGFVIYFIIFKLKGNKDEQSFTEYMSEDIETKTDVLSETETKEENDFDPLAENIQTTTTTEQVPDWLTGANEELNTKTSSAMDVFADVKNSKEDEMDFSEEETKTEENNSENNTENNLENSEDSEIPAWLKATTTIVDDDTNENNSENSKDSESEDILSTEENNLENIETSENTENSENNSEISKDSEIPDWLTSTEEKTDEFDLSEDNSETSNNLENEDILLTPEENSSTEEKTDENLPSWLTASDETENTVQEDDLLEEKDILSDEENISPDENIEADTEIPDWLTASSISEEKTETLEEDSKEEVKENIETPVLEEKTEEKPVKTRKTSSKTSAKKEEKQETSKNTTKKRKSTKRTEEVEINPDNGLEVNSKEELEEITKIDLTEEKSKEDEDNLPDWLKGTFEDTKEKIDKVEEKVEEVKPKKTKTSTKTKTTKKQKTDDKDFSKFSSLDEDQTKTSNSNADELWDDGMKIPDWLKTDSDK